jgi:hypothetical protein
VINVNARAAASGRVAFSSMPVLLLLTGRNRARKTAIELHALLRRH